MKYQTIIATTHNIASASTTQWGSELESIVRFFAVPFALVLTALQLVVDFFERPLQTLGMLAPPVRPVAEPIPLHPDVPTHLPTPKAVQLPVATPPVRRRATRKRGLSEIRSLTA